MLLISQNWRIIQPPYKQPYAFTTQRSKTFHQLLLNSTVPSTWETSPLSSSLYHALIFLPNDTLSLLLIIIYWCKSHLAILKKNALCTERIPALRWLCSGRWNRYKAKTENISNVRSPVNALCVPHTRFAWWTGATSPYLHSTWHGLTDLKVLNCLW